MHQGELGVQHLAQVYFSLEELGTADKLIHVLRLYLKVLLVLGNSTELKALIFMGT